MVRLLILALAVIGAIVVFRRLADAARAARLRRAFANRQALIGLTPEQVFNLVGPWQHFGSMDHGEEVASWHCLGLWFEVWFKNGHATAVVDRSNGKTPVAPGDRQ